MTSRLGHARGGPLDRAALGRSISVVERAAGVLFVAMPACVGLLWIASTVRNVGIIWSFGLRSFVGGAAYDPRGMSLAGSAAEMWTVFALIWFLAGYFARSLGQSAATASGEGGADET